MPRSYNLGKREASVQQTRAQVIAAAHALIIENGFHHAGMGDIARRAGVTRATVYNQFGSKMSLLEAVTTTALERAGLNELIPLLAAPNAREVLDLSLRAATGMWAAEHEFFQRVIGLAVVDPDARQVIARRDAERIGAQQLIAQRLAEQGYLQPGVDQETAAQVLILISSFQAFDVLYGDAGLPAAAMPALLTRLTEPFIRARRDDS